MSVRRFRFSLERVLEYKARRERLAEMQQLRALAALRTCEQAAAELLARWERADAPLRRGATGALDVTSWFVHLRHVERLARDLAAARTRVHEATILLERASALHRQQALEAEALRQLRHRQHERHQEQEA